jgi:hypothetical protein
VGGLKIGLALLDSSMTWQERHFIHQSQLSSSDPDNQPYEEASFKPSPYPGQYFSICPETNDVDFFTLELTHIRMANHYGTTLL